MTIIRLMPFVLTSGNVIGLANEEGTTASQMWCISEEGFNSISGRKFSWIAPNGSEYVDDRDIFSRPTEDQVKEKISSSVKSIAIQKGYIKE